MKSFYYTAIVVFSVIHTGCSVSKLLVGQVDPVDHKSDTVEVTPLEIIDSKWKRIDSSGSDSAANAIPDRAWQSSKTASVISLNSACRQANDAVQGYSEMEPKEISADILSQWRDVTNKSERDLQFSGFPALETTAEGYYFDRKRKFQTLIVKTPACVYDLIFLASPKSFAQDLVTFHKFRDKLIIK